MDIFTYLLLGHVIGTILGVGGATFIEIHLNNALRDGNVSPDEKMVLASTYRVVRIGLVISLLTGFGFLLIYKITGQTFRLYNGLLWAKILMVVIIAANAILLQVRKISLYWGSAVSFVSWWAVAIIGFFLTNSVRFSFIEAMGAYIVIVLIGAAVLHRIRERNKKQIV